MITYLKLGKVRGLPIEVDEKLGRKPFFRKNSFHYETIIDIPYVQITYTSGQWSLSKNKPVRRASNGNLEKDCKTSKDAG